MQKAFSNIKIRTLTFIYNYIILARLHRPAPIFLLIFPAYWSIALNVKESINQNMINTFFLYVAILLGGILSRSAGSVINDIADRKIDKLVERTKNRKLANNEISLFGAITFFILLSLASLSILLTFNKFTIFLSLIGGILIILYPFTKRFTYFPQVFLGITFSFGVLIGQAAVIENLTLPVVLLYIACIFWVIGFDSIYAIQDYKCDKIAGIKSIVVVFQENIQSVVGYLYLTTLILLILVGILIKANFIYYIILFLVMLHFIWQVINININRPYLANILFNYNVYVGLLIWIAFLVG